MGEKITVNGVTYEVLDESSLSRVVQHCKNGFISISASRSDNKDADGNLLSPEENDKVNRQNTKALENDIRRNGLGFISTVGGYPENVDGKVNWVTDEESKFIPYNPKVMSFQEFHDLAIKLAKKYKQDSVVIGKPVDTSDENEPIMDAELWGHDPDNWTYTLWDSWKNFRLPSIQNIMNRVKAQKMVYYSKLKKGSHAGTKFEYSQDSAKSDPYNESYALAVYVPGSYSGRVGAASRGEAFYLGVDVSPSPYFEETELERENAVYANEACKERFLKGCYKINFDKTSAVNDILNGVPIREAVLNKVAEAKKSFKGSGKKISFEDDLVVVLDAETGNELYKGVEDYEDLKDEPWKWDDSIGAYRLEKDVDGNHYSYIKNCVS